MSVNVKVEPFNSESISTAIVGEWFKEEGDFVEADELLVELETDKINIPVHSPVAGVLTSIKAAFDEEVSEGNLLAEIEEGAKAEGSSNGESSDDQDSSDSADKADKAAAASGSESQHDALSPAVQRLVEENDLNPADIKATGPNGRLLKGDVLAHLESGPKKSDSSSKPASKPAQRTRRSNTEQDTGAREERERMSRLRQTVAKRLVSAQQDAAMLTTFNEVDMSAVIELRNQYKMAFKDKYGIKLGFMSFFIKAAIEALKAYPKVNAEIDGDTIVYKNYYNIGVAVGGGRGLVVPVIRDANQLSFAEVELTINELVNLAVNNRLTLDDLTGGTFTLSNGGIYGSMLSTPILNPPQSGILGMHNIVERPVAINGQVEIRPIMYLALSYDHRIIDGREAVSFLVRLKECIEAPERILLEI